jgi:hypothetical protein
LFYITRTLLKLILNPKTKTSVHLFTVTVGRTLSWTIYLYTRNTCMHRLHAATPRMYFPNIDLTWSISNWLTLNLWLNAGSRLHQCCHGPMTCYINYITMNFRNMYCRYVDCCSAFCELWFNVKFNVNRFVKCFEMFILILNYKLSFWFSDIKLYGFLSV